MGERITIEELESYLWNSAVLLRSSIDAGAYKQYIFPLLFFKRICDVYDEEPGTQKKAETYKPAKPFQTAPMANLSKRNFSSKVMSLFNSGYQVEQIAKELSCTVTEVQLIIDMGL